MERLTLGSSLPIERMDDIRSKIANAALVVLSIIAIPALAASLLRAQDLGFQPAMVVQIVAVAVVWVTTIFRGRLSITVRGGLLVLVLIAISLGGFFNFALSGAGQAFFLSAVVFAAIILGRRFSAAVLVLGVITIAAIGWAYCAGAIGLSVDLNHHNIQVRSWITASITMLALGGGLLAAIIGLNAALSALVARHEERRSDLEQVVSERTVELNQRIQEQDRVEASLRLSEQRYQDFIERQRDIITEFTIDGRITFVNTAYCDYVGDSRDALVGTSIFDAVPDSEVAALKKFLAQLSPQVPSLTGENQVEARYGDLRYFEWSNTASFDDQGNITKILSVGRDVTDQKKVDRMKDEFVSVTSHELRTPLTSIMGAVSVVKNGIAGDISDEAKDLLEVAHKNGERLDALVKDILDLSKIEAGGLKLKISALNVRRLLQEAMELNGSLATEYGCEYAIREDIEDFQVTGDPERLGQVLTNFLSNAAKFAPRGSRVELGAARRGRNIRVSVWDQGDGIPTEFREHIFKRFSQADSTDTRRQSGTGLGLSIAKQIIELHHGKIGFVSDAGEATEFYFELPELPTGGT